MRASRRNWSHLAVGVRRLGRQYANHHRGDVVVSAVHVRFLDQSVDDSLGLGARQQKLLNAPVIDHSCQAVTREKKRVTNMGVAVEHVRLDLIGHSDAASDDIALRMLSRLLWRQKTRIDLLLHQRVILGELAQLAVPNDIDARITHVSHNVPRLREKKSGDGAPHSQLVPLGARPLVHGPIRIAERASDPVVRIA